MPAVFKLHGSPGAGAVCELPDDGEGLFGDMLAGSVTRL
jgi:hypothetical protein